MDELPPDLDDLMREILEIPSPEVRLAGLAQTREILERQLDEARVSELHRLRAIHRAEQAHSDDASLDEYELEVQVTHLLPKVVRGGMVLAIWSTLEACTKGWAAYAATQTGSTLDPAHFKAGSFVEASDRAFHSLLRISAYATQDMKASLSRLAAIRAALVHHNGNIAALPTDLREGNLLALEAGGLYIERDLHHSYFVPSAAFVERNLSIVAEHLSSLSVRVKAALRISTKRDA